MFQLREYCKTLQYLVHVVTGNGVGGCMAGGGQMSGVLSGRLPAASLLGGALAVWCNMKSSAVMSCVVKQQEN